MRLHITENAERDLKSIWAYIAADNRAAADGVHAGFARRFESILRYPRIGRYRADIAYDVRAIPVGRYLILYTLASDAIYIMRVLHGAREIPKVYQEDEY